MVKGEEVQSIWDLLEAYEEVPMPTLAMKIVDEIALLKESCLTVMGQQDFFDCTIGQLMMTTITENYNFGEE